MLRPNQVVTDVEVITVVPSYTKTYHVPLLSPVGTRKLVLGTVPVAVEVKVPSVENTQLLTDVEVELRQ